LVDGFVVVLAEHGGEVQHGEDGGGGLFLAVGDVGALVFKGLTEDV
jgi:hypothetical protein